jgi:hypothetical protein
MLRTTNSQVFPWQGLGCCRIRLDLKGEFQTFLLFFVPAELPLG